MLAVAFDTLKLARTLESAGMQPKQAQDMAAALSDSLTEWHSVGDLATKDDIQELRTQLAETKGEILKWMFAQTLVLLGAVFGLIGLLHAVKF